MPLERLLSRTLSVLKAQLLAAQAAEINVGVQRGQDEHAIARFTGGKNTRRCLHPTGLVTKAGSYCARNRSLNFAGTQT